MKCTIQTIQKYKNKQKITMITAYDALMARIFDGEVDSILVGDSLAMSFGGYPDTLPLTIDDMIYHTKAVRRVVHDSLLIADMPFGSYDTPQEALKNATRLYKEAGADAVKLEGGLERYEHVRHLADNGIAVMAHIGLKPQFVRSEGGYKIKGKTELDKTHLLHEVQEFSEAGAFAILLEGVVAETAAVIARASSVPVIGIGSGANVDGQVLVWSDAFGFFTDFQPKFVRRYLDGANLLKEALQRYVSDVKSGAFPSENESY